MRGKAVFPFVALLAAALSSGCSEKSAASATDGGASSASTTDGGDGGLARADAGASADDGAMPTTASNEELTARMRHFVEAIAQNNPDLAGDVLFPRDAYVQVKDLEDPQKGWEKKVAGPFRRAVGKTHKRTHGAEGAKFVSFELGKAPEQVAAKRKDLKKPLYRVKHSRLTFSIEGKSHTVTIAEMTAWRGAWYVTKVR